MNLQKLHYENLGGTLVRREGLLSWRCPLCKAGGQSLEVMRTCPECGSKEATLPGAQAAPSVPEGWKLVPIEVVGLYNFMCAAFVPMTPQQEQIAVQLELAKREMLAAAPEAKP